MKSLRSFFKDPEKLGSDESPFKSLSSVADQAKDLGRTIVSADYDKSQEAVIAALWRTISPGYEGIDSDPRIRD